MGNNEFMRGGALEVLVLCHNCYVAEEGADTSHMTMEQAVDYSTAMAKWHEVNEGKFHTLVGPLPMDHGQCQFCRSELSDRGFGVVMAVQEERS